MVPVAPIITGITVVFTFHIHLISIVRSLYYYYYYYYYYYVTGLPARRPGNYVSFPGMDTNSLFSKASTPAVGLPQDQMRSNVCNCSEAGRDAVHLTPV